LQRDRGGEPADAAANDQRANGRLPRLAVRVGYVMPAPTSANPAVKGLLMKRDIAHFEGTRS
jgi:hypothetical protein